MTTVELPWPVRPLWPNWRGHWAKKSVVVSKAKADACYLTHGAMGFDVLPAGTEKLTVAITFRPPTRRRYDLDNALAACKAALDGIALALHVDDSRFHLTLDRGEPVKLGKVVVRIT